jgi:colicin import membrane protein
MPRVGITFEEVAAAADAIIGEGQQPTIKLVRERIGKGSDSTVHTHLTVWREARPKVKAAAPELPASLANAIATEIERAAASARSEIENKLVLAQIEANELSSAGEALEVERDEMLEQVTELTTERDRLMGKLEQQTASIKAQAERIEREQQSAEAARVELAKAQLKIESGAERLVEQVTEIERLRALLESEGKAKTTAEQQSAVALARLEAMTDRATKAELRTEQAEKQSEQARQEINVSRNQVQALQAELNTAVRALDDAHIQLKEAKAEAKKAIEEAAELRGKLIAPTQKKTVAKEAKD